MSENILPLPFNKIEMLVKIIRKKKKNKKEKKKKKKRNIWKERSN
jgi:hypothetical protein